MNDFINSLRDERIEGFRQRYRNYDVLLDRRRPVPRGEGADAGGVLPHVQHLYEAGKQIVLSSDRPPKEIPTLEERLRSRFEWGLIADIQPPDLETRVAILKK